MESYIEVTYGVNAIILILCTMTSDMLFQYPASVMRIVGISLCFTLVLMIIDDHPKGCIYIDKISFQEPKNEENR